MSSDSSRYSNASPDTARNRSPAASGCRIARTCRSATSRTSTAFTVPRGTAGYFPLRSASSSSSEADRSVPIAGPKMPTGFTVASSRSPPSRPTKSHAARSASVFDRTYGVIVGEDGSVQSSSVNRRPGCVP